MAFDYEYLYMRNLGGDGLHEDPDTFDLGHEGESDPASGLESLTERIAGDATFDGNDFRVCYAGADCKVQFTDALTTPEEAALDDHVADQRVQADWNVLADLKEKKMQEFDVRTAELIGEGFTYSAKVFSLTPQMQEYAAAIRATIADHRVLRTEVAFEAAFFPVVFNTIDNMDKISLATMVTFESFHDAIVDGVRTHEDSGTALKDLVRAAANKAEVDAVVDER